MPLGTEGLIECHWEGERPPPLVGNQQGFHWTRVSSWWSESQIWPFSIFGPQKIVNFLPTLKKKKKKGRRNWTQRNPDTWLLLKPESLVPRCPSPHDDSQPSRVKTLPGVPGTRCQGCACHPAGLAHVTENIHLNWHHVPGIPIFQDPHSISQTDSSTPSSKKIVRLCFLIHSLENSVTAIITQRCDDWTQLVWAAQGAESTSTPHLTHWFTQLFNPLA